MTIHINILPKREHNRVKKLLNSIGSTHLYIIIERKIFESRHVGSSAALVMQGEFTVADKEAFSKVVNILANKSKVS